MSQGIALYKEAEYLQKPCQSLMWMLLPCEVTGHGTSRAAHFACPALASCPRSPASYVLVRRNNDNLGRLSCKIVSPLIFAHVRAAYPGMPVSEQNCHPFQWGRYLWMHNGVVGGFMKIRRKLLACLSDEAYDTVQSFHSDSAISFAIFLHHLPSLQKPQTPQVLLTAMQVTTCHHSPHASTPNSPLPLPPSFPNSLVESDFPQYPMGQQSKSQVTCFTSSCMPSCSACTFR